MFVFIVRHGEETAGFRGGWSNTELSAEGKKQAESLAEYFFSMQHEYKIKTIFSSDLKRAVQTAGILSEKLGVSIVEMQGLREVNNGKLVGMDNKKADKDHPGLYWKALAWKEKYPNGESPADFYERIAYEWKLFLKNAVSENNNLILVTHGGVIQIILSILKGEKYSNKKSFGSISCCDIIKLEL